MEELELRATFVWFHAAEEEIGFEDESSETRLAGVEQMIWLEHKAELLLENQAALKVPAARAYADRGLFGSPQSQKRATQRTPGHPTPPQTSGSNRLKCFKCRDIPNPTFAKAH
eukprot:4571984-Amphidinium_carterae.1